MSYSIAQARSEQDNMIIDAIVTRDSEALYQIAGIVKEQGEDEEAERLLTIAKQIDWEDAQADQVQADKEERETEQQEAGYYPSEGYGDY